MTGLIDIPTGAVLTEMYAYVVAPTTGDSVWMLVQHPYANTYTISGFTNVGAAVGPQTVPLAAFTPIKADGVLTVPSFEWFSTVNDGSHSVMGFTAGWILNPGLVTFTGPRRVYGDGTVLAAGQPVLGVDATRKLDGTPSGVPVGAKAAFCAISSYGTGVVSLYPDGTPDNGIGAWASQGTAGNGVNQGYNLVPLSAAGKFSFTNYFTNKAMYFDVWGFLA